MLSEQMEEFLRSLPDRPSYSREDLLVEATKLAEEPSQGLRVYDAPVGWINPTARVALIGVTPGFTQMEILCRVARRQLLDGASGEAACKTAKYKASFGGSMRGTLVRMLDDLGLHELLSIPSSDDLFGSAAHLLHTTSAIRYPTFYKGQNCSGSRPHLIRSDFLMGYARKTLAPELSSLRGAVFIPLGMRIAEVLALLEKEGRVPAGRTLHGFPHPSGANGHRGRVFEESKGGLSQGLRDMLHANPVPVSSQSAAPECAES